MNETVMASEAIRLLKSLVGIPSLSREEEAVADFLQNYMFSVGIVANRRGNNIWCINPDFDDSKPTLLLNSHIDTVKPVAGWKKHPFTAKEEDGKLYGLGSNDAGGSVVSLFQVFRELTVRKQPYNLIYLASCEEEISGSEGVESVLPLLPPIALAVVGEPTGMHLAIAEKGLMVLDCVARGVSGHVASEGGVNAIYAAMKDIEWFRSFRFEKESGLLGPVRMNVTQIEAGVQSNVVPDECSFVVDVRSNELYSNEELFDIISRSVSAEVKARSFRLNSSRIDVSNPLVLRAEELGRKLFGSPTLSDQALMAFPTVKIGPGDPTRSHTADEYILLSEIEEAIPLYIQLLDGLQL